MIVDRVAAAISAREPRLEVLVPGDRGVVNIKRMVRVIHRRIELDGDDDTEPQAWVDNCENIRAYRPDGSSPKLKSLLRQAVKEVVDPQTESA